MQQKESFGERLRLLMQERDIGYEQLGRLLDMNAQTLNRYALGQREPKAGAAARIALALGVEPLWLQGYDVPRRETRALQTESWKLVPVLGRIRAGAPMLAVQEPEGYAAANVPDPSRYFYLRVQGDSMEGAGIRDGDLVLIQMTDCAENGQIVACLLDGGETTLKRFFLRGDSVLLQAENPAYAPRIVPAAEFENGSARIIGAAVQLTRKL